jgi:processive 1,2-diacylglycerol beta-glucosyltransferase
MAGVAVTEALRRRHPQVEVAHIDAVARMWTAYKHVYRWGYLQLVDKHPILWRTLYETTNRKTSALTHALTVLAGRGFVRLCRRWKPKAIVCTHFLAPEILARAVRRGKLTSELHVVVTDHDTHRVWYYPEVTRYYVATELVRGRLAYTYGVPQERIAVTGIPVRRAFSSEPDPVPVRLSYGLDPNRPTVLFMSAGFAASGMRRSILGVWRERRDVQVIAVCGRNARMRRRIAAMPRPEGAVLHALGFVEDVRGLMAAADLVVAKSGGVTTSECMAAGRPMLVSGSIPGQEERNADAVVEAGAGVRALTPEEVRWHVARLLAEPARLRDLALGARAFGRPEAAGRVADSVAAAVRAEDAVPRPRFHGAV